MYGLSATAMMGTPATLIDHWDGSVWSVVPSPDPGSNYNELYSIDAVSDTDIWAVGNAVTESGQGTLTEHWDGSAWSIVPSPNVGIAPNFLNAVAAVSSNNVWAVGYYETGRTELTLIEHWNGSAWDVVRSPNVGGGDNVLNGVSAVSSSDVWAVGSSPDHELIEHWNGTEWTIVSSPHQGGLNAVTTLSHTDVWAVGSGAGSRGVSTLTEHWNGRTWSVVPSPDVDQYNILYSVSAVSSNDIWAVGRRYWIAQGDYPGGETHALLEHWDGTAWSVVPGADLHSNEYIYGVAALGADAWVVGNKSGSTPSALIEHYAAPCPPTLTPVPPRCPGERFTDVCPGDYFYQHVLDLNDLGIIAGYNTAPPCASPAHIPCFKPDNSATRGQIAEDRIVGSRLQRRRHRSDLRGRAP